jgi:hypothetical protein
MSRIDGYPNKGERVVYREIDGQAVVIILSDSPEGGSDKVNIFNPTATHIWQLIDGKRGVKDIIQMVCNEFEITFTKAEKDVIDFISALRKKNLITINSKKS